MLTALPDQARLTTAALTRALTTITAAGLYASLLGGHFTLLSARTYRFVGRMSWNMGS